MDDDKYNNQREDRGYLTRKDKEPKSNVLDMGKFREELRQKEKQKLERKILKKFINHDKNLGWK